MALLTNAQTQQTVKFDKCLTPLMEKEELKNNPDYAKNQEALELYTKEYIKRMDLMKTAGAANKTATAPLIIPVVFHIIHNWGAENISDAQCQDQIAVLNADYRRLNADTTNTPGPFQSIGADVGVEFRLAQLDPNGNCTNGIERIVSSATANARNNVKSLSYWPSNKYLNIWVVNSIENSAGSPGSVIGFAQFPGGAATTDGVVLHYGFVGTIGTAAGNNSAGRTATHEVGHWLNLRHIWGDDGGSCSGTDLVNDTPNQADMTFGGCPSFPKTDACTPNGNGILYSDYMDYTDGDCQNIFTVGQSTRMNAALSSTISGRNNLYTAANLIATGTDGTPPVTCAPIPSIIKEVQRVCAGSSIDFIEDTYNGPVTSRLWSFPGGTPATSTTANTTVTYNTPGKYDVTLTVSNSAGSNSKTYTNYVSVYPAAATTNAPFSEGFETITFPGTDYEIDNFNNDNTWTQTSLAAASGTKSVYIPNFIGNSYSDEFVTPSYNTLGVTGVSLSFKLAFAKKNNTNTCLDVLQVDYSTNCGLYWTNCYKKSASNTALPLYTTTSVYPSSAFIPIASQWRLETKLLPSLANKSNIRFKFTFTSGTGNYGNNIYIDDINLNGTVGIDETFGEQIEMMLSPNPTNNTSNLSFYTTQTNDVQIRILDIVGKECNTLQLGKLAPGEHKFEVGKNLSSGIYFVELIANGNKAVRKLIVE